MRRRTRGPGRGLALALGLLLLVGAAVWAGHTVMEATAIQVPRLTLSTDANGNGRDDLTDMVEGALQCVENGPDYVSAYYAGGYPPEDEGVCTDVIWRAFQAAGYQLKDLVDQDIAAHPEEYPRVTAEGGADPNIDFRRVTNLDVFFRRNAAVLTCEVVPRDLDNLSQWQGGDVVTVKDGGQYHIGILSTKRNWQGVPYVIHHPSGKPVEEDCLLEWYQRGIILGHYRYPAEQ